MGRVYKRKRSPYYQAEFKGPGGKPIRRSTETKDKVEAKRLLAEWEHQAWEKRHFGEQEDLTLVRLRDLWLSEAAEKKTLAQDKLSWRIILEYFDGDRLVSSLRRADLLELRAWLGTSGKKGKRKPASVNRILVCLFSSLRATALHEQYRGLVNEAMLAKILVPEKNRRDRVVEQHELDALIAAAKPRMKLAIQIAVETTMRLGEICAMRWDWIRAEKTEGGELVIHIPAGEHKNDEPKSVPVSSTLRRILDQHRVDLARRFKMKPEDVRGSVLIPKAKAPSMSKTFGDLADKVDLGDITFHDFRATGAVRMIESGVDIFTVQKITGHKSLHALQRYARMAQKHKREAIERISGDKH